MRRFLLRMIGPRLLPIVPLLALMGCAPENPLNPFGVSIAFEANTGERGGSSCTLAHWLNGHSETYSAVQMDSSTTLPDLWLEETYDVEAETFTIRIVEVTEYGPVLPEPKTKSTLVERVYDKSFGDQSQKEELHVESDGVGYDLEILGLPESKTDCGLTDPDIHETE